MKWTTTSFLVSVMDPNTIIEGSSLEISQYPSFHSQNNHIKVNKNSKIDE